MPDFDRAPSEGPRPFRLVERAKGVREIVSDYSDARRYFEQARARCAPDLEELEAAVNAAADVYRAELGADPRDTAKRRNLIKHSEAIDNLVPVLSTRPIIPATATLPAHITTPSGAPAKGVILHLQGPEKVGKVTVMRGTVVAGKTELKAKDTFFTAEAFGWASLEDVRDIIRETEPLFGFFTQSTLKDGDAQLVGVRCAFKPQPSKYLALDNTAFADGRLSNRLLILDMDGLEVPRDFDLHSPDALMQFIFDGGYLPDELRGVSVMLCPTASHGMQNGEMVKVGLRIFAVTDRAVTKAERGVWLPKINGKGCDPSVFGGQQKVYLSRIVRSEAEPDTSVADPFADLNCTILPGEPMCRVPDLSHLVVQAPPKSKGPRSARAKGASQGPRAATRLTGTIEETRASIGDHEGGAGFYAPTLRLVGQLVRQAEVLDDATRSRIIADVTATILAADTSGRDGQKQPVDYVAQLPQMVDAFMDRDRSERAKAVAAAERSVRQYGGPDTEPLPTLSADEGAAILLSHMAAGVALFARTDRSAWEGVNPFHDLGELEDPDHIACDPPPPGGTPDLHSAWVALVAPESILD